MVISHLADASHEKEQVFGVPQRSLTSRPDPGVLLKEPRGPLKGPRGPLKEPRCPLKGPRGPLKGPRLRPNGDERTDPDCNEKASGLRPLFLELRASVTGSWLKIGRFRCLGGPGGLKTIQGGGGRSPPPLRMVLKPPGAAKTPKTTYFQPKPKPPSAKPPSGNRRFLLGSWTSPGRLSLLGLAPPARP